MPSPNDYPHFSTGPVLVSFGGKALGYSMNGVDIQEQPVYQDLKNDAYGGMAGMPSDVQFLGGVALVTANLNRFTEANLENLSQFDSAMAGTDGTLPEVGDFVKQDELHGALVLSSPVETRTYDVAYLVQGRAFNAGVPERVYRLVFRVLIDDPCVMKLWAASAADDPCTS